MRLGNGEDSESHGIVLSEIGEDSENGGVMPLENGEDSENGGEMVKAAKARGLFLLCAGARFHHVDDVIAQFLAFIDDVEVINAHLVIV